MKWDDTYVEPGEKDLSGDAVGWGVNLSSNLKIKKDVLRLQFVDGEGIQNYMNDAPVDVAIEDGEGEALPVMGLVAFFDLNWSDKWTSTVGYSQVGHRQLNGQADERVQDGAVCACEPLYYPAPGRDARSRSSSGSMRENNSDDWDVDDLRVQFSVKYNFKYSTGGN